MVGEACRASINKVGVWLFRLVTNPAHFVTCILKGVAKALVNAENWLEHPSKLSNIKAQKVSHFFCTAANWLFIKRLKVTMTFIQFIWNNTFGALGEAVKHFQDMARAKDINSSHRSKAKKIFYGIVSGFLSLLSWTIFLFPVFAYVAHCAPFLTMIGWFKHLGQKIDFKIKHLIATQDANDILATANLYSLREIGVAISNLAAGLWCMIFATVSGLLVMASRKLFGLCQKKKPIEDDQKEPEPEKRNLLIEQFLAEYIHLKEDWDKAAWIAILRVAINPAKIIGLIIGSFNYGLVSLSRYWKDRWFGKFLNCFIIDRLQILIQLVQYIWGFIGGEMANTIDHCLNRAFDSSLTFWARLRAGFAAGLLGIFSWLLVVEPYIGAFSVIAKALPFMKWMNAFGSWLHGKMMEGTVISTINNVMGWAGLYPFRLLGEVISSTSIFIWTFIVTSFFFKANNKVNDIKKPGPVVDDEDVIEDLAEDVLGVDFDALKAMMTPAPNPANDASPSSPKAAHAVLAHQTEEKPSIPKKPTEASGGMGWFFDM